MRKLIILILIPFQLFSAETITLKDCQSWARQNYPTIRNLEVWNNISKLNLENIGTSHLPGINLNGQATYQSEVTNIPISIPGMQIPEVSKNQYKVYLDIRQNIWDGGLSNAQKELEKAMLVKNLSSVESELYHLNEKVSKLWFSILFAKNNSKVFESQIAILKDKTKIISSGVKNGVLEASNLDIINAEIIGLEQNIYELDAAHEGSLKVLSILTGKEITNSNNFLNIETETKSSTPLTRPELNVFQSHTEFLDLQAELVDKTRNPKLFGFGQAGYGKPGLNMLSNEFDAYYLVGLGLNWKVSDWKKSRRDKQLLTLQKEFIQSQEEVFKQNIDILLTQQQVAINKINKLIVSDFHVLELRQKIAASSASKLENGTITSTEYLQDVQGETIAKIKLETHKIQLIEAKTNYQIIKGL